MKDTEGLSRGQTLTNTVEVPRARVLYEGSLWVPDQHVHATCSLIHSVFLYQKRVILLNTYRQCCNALANPHPKFTSFKLPWPALHEVYSSFTTWPWPHSHLLVPGISENCTRRLIQVKRAPRNLVRGSVILRSASSCKPWKRVWQGIRKWCIFPHEITSIDSFHTHATFCSSPHLICTPPHWQSLSSG